MNEDLDLEGPPVPVMRPRLPAAAELLPHLEEMDRSGWYTNFGPQERRLRGRFAALLGVDEGQVATAANATLCLQGAAAVSPATSWVLPSFTFPASPMALLQAGKEIRFADIREEDWWLDVTSTPPTGETTGVMPVAPLGNPFELSRWDPSQEVIIDAAASLGGDLPPLEHLPARWAVVFSLHATKCLPAGEGGLVVFGDRGRAERFRSWTNFGFEASQRSRASRLVGTNAKLSEIGSAYAHVSLDRWDEVRSEWLDARHRVDALEVEHGLLGQPGQRGGVSPYWVVAFPDGRTREAAERSLSEQGIETRRWWSRACHRMPALAGQPRSPLPVTESVSDRMLGLPMFRGLEDGHIARISAALTVIRHLWEQEAG